MPHTTQSRAKGKLAYNGEAGLMWRQGNDASSSMKRRAFSLVFTMPDMRMLIRMDAISGESQSPLEGRVISHIG